MTPSLGDPQGTLVGNGWSPANRSCHNRTYWQGVRFQPVRFKDPLKVRCKTVSVVTGPPEPPPPHRPVQGRGSARTEADRWEIARLCALGLTQKQIVKETGWSKNTIQRAYSELVKNPKDPKKGG
jgi:hypothetical protein